MGTTLARPGRRTEADIPAALESKVDRAGEKSAVSSGPATIAVSALEDDDFGDFESASTPSNAPAPSVSSVGGVPADLQKAGTGGNVNRDYGSVVRTPENWMI